MFFFYKKKTADEVRSSVVSSDVCSSDLVGQAPRPVEHVLEIARRRKLALQAGGEFCRVEFRRPVGIFQQAVEQRGILRQRLGKLRRRGQQFGQRIEHAGIGLQQGEKLHAGRQAGEEERRSVV